MMSEIAIWLIFLVPLISFGTIVFVLRPFFNKYDFLAAPITITSVAVAFFLSLLLVYDSLHNGFIEHDFNGFTWIQVSNLEVNFNLILDPLSIVMLVVVSSVSLLVQIYSVGYMKDHHGHRDPGYARYFAYMSFFTASMLGLVLSRNLVQVFVFWELVGVSSYLLIGFWFEKPSAAAAAKKAFIVTRVGDFGFLLGLLYLFLHSGIFVQNGLNVFSIPDLYTGIHQGLISSSVATWVALGILAGAAGKSGQFLLHVWLPDAMEGPTPVSALIHAATMVAAGIFLVARFYPLFELTDIVMNIVAILGAVTLLFSATMGLVMNDIKRVLAYSTISQLGYMMLALGIGAYAPAIFHLFTHAFFKALLFMGSGSVNHATGTFDMRFMGGLRKEMPITYWTFLIGSLSLAGLFPLAGFWSKDEILAYANHGDQLAQIVLYVALLGVVMTSVYMFRAIFMTFFGEFRGGSKSDPEIDDSSEVHISESPKTMLVPMTILAVMAIVAGFLANPLTDLVIIPIHWFTEFLEHGPVHIETHHFNVWIAVISTFLSAMGIFFAFSLFRETNSRKTFLSTIIHNSFFRYLHSIFQHKYYFDEFYENIVVFKLFYLKLVNYLDWLDKYFVDRIYDLIGKTAINIGEGVRQLQTGQTQVYGVGISAGMILVIALLLLFKNG